MAIEDPRNGNDNAGASILLIGFRGVGKSTLALIVATYLGRPFIDCDRALSKHAGCTPNEYIDRHSWEGFRCVEGIRIVSKS